MSTLDAVARLVGLQAQAPNAPYLGLWSRVAGLALDDLTRLLEDRSVVRSSTLRGNSAPGRGRGLRVAAPPDAGDRRARAAGGVREGDRRGGPGRAGGGGGVAAGRPHADPPAAARSAGAALAVGGAGRAGVVGAVPGADRAPAAQRHLAARRGD